jgi:nucleotide-binding universal stress UspA family protein
MDAQHSGRAVVVGIDGSSAALQAVRWAAAEAVRRKAPLRVVTAFSWSHGHLLGRVGGDGAYRDALLELAHRQLAEAVVVAEEVTGRSETEHEIIADAAILALLAESRQAQLVVLGDRGLGAISGLLVGSVADALSTHGECPVVLVRTEAGRPVEDWTRPVVVGVDGSPASEPALGFAFDAAAARGVPVVAVHTWWDLLANVTMAPMLDLPALQENERQVLAERLAGWGEKYPEVTVRRLVTRDHAAHALVEQSRQAQLVVVGSRRRIAVARLVLGSVGHTVRHRAHCSVAVVSSTVGVEDHR